MEECGSSLTPKNGEHGFTFYTKERKHVHLLLPVSSRSEYGRLQTKDGGNFSSFIDSQDAMVPICDVV